MTSVDWLQVKFDAVILLTVTYSYSGSLGLIPSVIAASDGLWHLGKSTFPRHAQWYYECSDETKTWELFNDTVAFNHHESGQVKTMCRAVFCWLIHSECLTRQALTRGRPVTFNFGLWPWPSNLT